MSSDNKISVETYEIKKKINDFSKKYLTTQSIRQFRSNQILGKIQINAKYIFISTLTNS